MAHILAQTTAPVPPTLPRKNPKSQLPSSVPGIGVSTTSSGRRRLVHGLIGLTLTTSTCFETAIAAARRPPPPPPTEKNDPNVSGVQAKVLASKKRKEAMKEAMAKLREKGKPVDGEKAQE